MFSKEELTFDDYCETRNVQKGTMYLDTAGSGEVADMVHVGRTGSFVPVRHGGGELYRITDTDGELKIHAVTGTKGHRWLDRELAKQRYDIDELFIDMEYFENLAQKAYDALAAQGDVGWFMSS